MHKILMLSININGSGRRVSRLLSVLMLLRNCCGSHAVKKEG